jgi:methylase of polypeptide subunit release factors
MDRPLLSAADQALLELLNRLEEEGYDFVTPTPATHARVVRRKEAGKSLRDILGWSLPFEAATAPPGLVEPLRRAGMLTEADGRLKSAIRVSPLRGRLYIHSAYPTEAADAVFLGPDSYRFADFVCAELTAEDAGLVVDVGGGCGVGAIAACDVLQGCDALVTDINPLALRFARINALHAGVALRTMETDGLRAVPDGARLVIANPPYMTDSRQTYRDGGDMHGAGLSLKWAREAMGKLMPGGRLLLYTGSAILDGGHDLLRAELERLAERCGAQFSYREIDPDVFGEELEREAYADVERIAAVGCVIERPA